MADSRLLRPINVGRIRLKHRMGMCPLTRNRASSDHIPQPAMKEYYTQRASVPGTLLVTEGTFISHSQAGYYYVPGIYNQAQVVAWRDITDAVHAKGSHIFCQLWALGRACNVSVAEDKGVPILSSSAVPIGEGRAVPTAMTEEQIQSTIADYASAAKNAIAAGFDGIELHGANGYLIDQFTQDVCNRRDDDWGGSIEKRSRFAVEVVRAVSQAIGPERVGIRLSPFSAFQSMKMQDPVSQFSDVIRKINTFGIAYVHLVDPRVSGTLDVQTTDSLNFAFDIWKGTFLIAGGFTATSARTLVDEKRPEKDIVVMFGRYFISNPDLPFRVSKDIEFTAYKRETFYNPQSLEGYTGYPFSEEFLVDSKSYT